MLVTSAPAGMAAGPSVNPRLSAPHAPAGAPSAGDRITNPDLPQGDANLKADLNALAKQIAGTGVTPTNTKNAPAAVRAAVALQRSLTPSQKSQLAGIVKKFSDRSAKILAGTKGPSNSPATGDAPDNVKSQAAALERLNARLNSRFAKVLTRSQYALHIAATKVVAKDVTNTANTNVTPANTNVTPQSSSTCYYGAYYASLATYWEYWGYYYSYYNYVTYGDTYAYYGYYYSYYAYAYGPSAARYLGAAYFDYLSRGSDWLGNGSTGASTAYTAYYDAYYGYLYNYYSYYYYGHTYAYYAYYYEYYAQLNAYYAYYYGTNYCR